METRKWNNLELTKNPCGLWLTRNGKIYKHIPGNPTETLFEEVIPEMSLSGYLYINDKNIPNCTERSTHILDKNNKSVYGKYLHRMMVFTFGDCEGRKYTSVGVRNIIDHLDMDHENNDVSNLQLVSYGINLFRAYYKTKMKTYTELNNAETRFKEYYKSLDEVDRKILDIEIEFDLQGKY